MKAINLIPGDVGRSGGGGARSGVGALVLLGVLGVLLAGVIAHVLTQNAIVERRAETAQLTTQLQAIDQQVALTRSYSDFATLAQARLQTVRQLGEARFDWHRTLADFSKVVPDDVWLTSLVGTVTSGVAVDSASSGSTSGIRSALPNPAIELSGCTTSQTSVARMLSRLRVMRGVTHVSLADTSKDSGGGGDCQHGDTHVPQFDVVVFFDPIPALPAAPVDGQAQTVAATTDPAAATTTATPPATGAATQGSEAR